MLNLKHLKKENVINLQNANQQFMIKHKKKEKRKVKVKYTLSQKAADKQSNEKWVQCPTNEQIEHYAENR